MPAPKRIVSVMVLGERYLPEVLSLAKFIGVLKRVILTPQGHALAVLNHEPKPPVGFPGAPPRRRQRPRAPYVVRGRALRREWDDALQAADITLLGPLGDETAPQDGLRLVCDGICGDAKGLLAVVPDLGWLGQDDGSMDIAACRRCMRLAYFGVGPKSLAVLNGGGDSDLDLVMILAWLRKNSDEWPELPSRAIAVFGPRSSAVVHGGARYDMPTFQGTPDELAVMRTVFAMAYMVAKQGWGRAAAEAVEFATNVARVLVR